MNKDIIYRQDAIDVLHGYFDGVLETDTICPKDIYNLFEIIPSAEPEIIRCKDCKYWREHNIPFCGFNAIYTKSDDFCSKGERRRERRTDERSD